MNNNKQPFNMNINIRGSRYSRQYSETKYSKIIGMIRKMTREHLLKNITITPFLKGPSKKTIPKII